MKNNFLAGIVTAALLAVAAALMGCSQFERTQDPQSGIVSPSSAEQFVGSVRTANAVSSPVNPYARVIEIFGQVAGAFLAGYGGAHVRIKRLALVDESPPNANQPGLPGLAVN